MYGREPVWQETRHSRIPVGGADTAAAAVLARGFVCSGLAGCWPSAVCDCFFKPFGCAARPPMRTKDDCDDQ